MVHVSQRITGCRQTGKLLCLTILAGMIALAVGEAKGTVSKLNVTASESPEELSTTTESPLVKRVTTVEGDELVSLELGKAENEPTTSPPFSNLWFNAGQSLGSAANSLTGWLNSRLVPQTTSSTTKPPEVIVRLQSNRGHRRPLITIDNNQNKKTQANRISGQQNNEEDDDPENEDEDTENEDEYEENDEEEVSAQNFNKIRYPSNNVQEEEEGDEEDDYSNSDEETAEDEDEDIVKPTKNRKNNRRQPNPPKPVNNKRRNEYEDESDDDEDFDYDLPHRHSGRQQQQQGFLNRIRQLAQNSYGSGGNNKPNRVTPTSKPNYRPVRIVQNGQIVQLVQNNRNRQQPNRRRRPSANQNTFQLIPINNNQLQGATQRPKRRRVAKPNPASQFIIQLPQNPSIASQNGQNRPNQFISIPWSRLGISNPQGGSNQNFQATAPIIVNIPQQNQKRRRRPIQRPTQVVQGPSRKRPGQPIRFRTQTGQMISVLTDENLRDIFSMPEIPPSRTPPEEMSPPTSVVNNWKHPLGTNEMQSIEVTTFKPDVSIKPEIEGEDGEDETSDEQEPLIVVGDDNSTDETLPRHGTSKHFIQIGGMKPFIDVLNKGRFYFKSGRQLHMDTDDRPETKVTSIDPERTLLVGSDEILAHDVTTDSSPLTGGNASKMTSSLDNTSTTRKLFTR